MSLLQIEAYAITLVVEATLALLIGPRLGASAKRAALAALIGSALSHPIFWPGAIALYPKLGAFTIPFLEALVVLFESIAYRLFATRSWLRAFTFSLLANFASWLIGILVFALR